jgi:thymidylate synthase (FAD)
VEIKVLDKGFARLVDHMGNDCSIVQSARVSYGAGTKTINDDTTLIRYMLRNKHTSVFEQVVFKFHIKAPIFVFRQWHRHRTWSFNELSGRYSVLKDECYIPEENKVTFQNPTNKQGGTDESITPFNIKNPDDWWDVLTAEQVAETWAWGDYFKNEQDLSHSNYERYVKSGMRKELARINLPVSQYSEMYATVDLHNLFHFLKLRMDNHAQWEIRQYAESLFELIKPIVPIACEAFGDYVLNSMTLSAKELQCLQHLIGVGFCCFDQETEKILTNKRELEEFNNKLNIILGH